MSARGQQAFEIPLHERQTFDTFVPGPNQAAVNSLRLALQDKASAFFFIYGPPGSGRTHLAMAATDACPAGQGSYLDMRAARALTPELISDLEIPEAVLALDNVEALSGDAAWELALFTLFNRWVDGARGLLLVTGAQSPDRLPFVRPDLGTRLASGIICPLSLPDEHDCVLILCRHAKERMLNLPEPTAAYLVRHENRSLPRLIDLLRRLDEEALRLKKSRLTIPLVKQLLALS